MEDNFIRRKGQSFGDFLKDNSELIIGKGSANRQYKDALFKFIFGNPEHKEWTLALYNMLNGTDYTNADAIEFNTLEDVTYIGIKNDLSFLLYDTLNVYEHQSTDCGNIALRMLFYIEAIYRAYIYYNGKNIYSKRRIDLPKPKCVCFYNGHTVTEPIYKIRLSDHFGGDSTVLDLVVTVYNINYNKDKKFLNGCRILYEYSWFVDNVNKAISDDKKLSIATVDKVIVMMPEDFKIKKFLMKHKMEVTNMLFNDITLEEYATLRAEEEREEAYNEGKDEGKIEAVKDAIELGCVSYEDASKILKCSVEELKRRLKKGLTD